MVRSLADRTFQPRFDPEGTIRRLNLPIVSVPNAYADEAANVLVRLEVAAHPFDNGLSEVKYRRMAALQQGAYPLEDLLVATDARRTFTPAATWAHGYVFSNLYSNFRRIFGKL